MNKRKYLRITMILVGILLLAWFGRQALDLRLNPPSAPSIAADTAAEVAQELTSSFEREHTRWNNQFAQKGFFALIGMFLALIGALPKKKFWIPKILFSGGLVALIIHHLLADGKIAAIFAEGIKISAFWIAAAFVVKGTGMWCTIWRWKVLLEGQGFRIPLKHLIQSFLIGRFIGSFAPGTSGLDGYRAYDISRYTGKVARSLAVIFVEKLIGFFVLGTLLLIAIPVGRSLFTEKNVNASALVMMGLLFCGMMLVSLVVLFKPGLIRWIADRFVPAASPLRKKVDKAVRAVAAYEKRKLHLLKALAIGFGVHTCTIGMYFCTSRALYEVVPSADLFVTSAMMIAATILPLSIAGIGMREGVFVFFLGPVAAIYAFAGYLVGEVISLVGGPVWLARRTDYYEVLKAQRDAINRDVEEDEDDEELPQAAAPGGPRPALVPYALNGLGAGLIAGLGVAVIDAARLWLIGGTVDWSLPGYAALLYGPFLALLGAGLGLVAAIFGRVVQRPAPPPIHTATSIGLPLFGLFTLIIGFFYLQRDLFGEKAGLFAPRMLGALAALVVGIVVLAVALGWLLRRLLAGARARHARLRLAAAVYLVIGGGLVALWAALGGAPSDATRLGDPPEDPRSRPNVVLVMNDTHRADHCGAYGGAADLTPHLDALAADGVVYANAFAQSSWTRPSVASILTGRYASSHTAMLKGSVLPDELTTLAEALAAGGYETLGLATNYNLTPFFNFDQGFVDYRYLTPDLPLGASDEQSKLIFVEVFKKLKARLRGSREVPEDYYVTGDVVTREALARLDRRDERRPFFMFLSYMDVHDPYFRHPFDGYGISHRANPNPDLAQAQEMKELYAGEVRYWDAQLGALVDGLKQRGLYDDTLVVVVSDHGEEFGEHGGFWHGTTLYDEQLRVIFIAKYPASAGVPAGTRVADWMRLIDVAPLIVDAAGLEIPAEWQGTPTPQSARTPVFAEEDHQGCVLTSVRFVEDGEETKLIRANPGNPRGLEPDELYRTDRDPAERENLAATSAGRLAKANGVLDSLAIKAAEGAVEAATDELSDEQKRVLKQLGYMKEGE